MPGNDPVKVNRAPRRWRRVELARTTLERGARHAAKTLVKAAKEGDTKTARWLLEHVEVPGEDGNPIRPLSAGIDQRGSNAQGPTTPEGPRVLIAVGLGRDFAQLANETPRLNSGDLAVTHALPVAVSRRVTE